MENEKANNYPRLSSMLFYFVFGLVCYCWHFDSTLKSLPQFHRSQIQHEIKDSLIAIFWLSIMTVPIFIAQRHGYSRVYEFGSASLSFEAMQLLLYVLFSDTCMYWLHRMFHHPFLFKTLHKKHH